MLLPKLKRLFHLSPIEGTPQGPTNRGTATGSLKKTIGRAFLDRLVFTAIWLPVGAFGILAKVKLLGSASLEKSVGYLSAQLSPRSYVSRG